MEKQMALIYTSHNFTTFQEEIPKSIDYNVRSLDQSENQRLIKVYLHGETEHQRDVEFMKLPTIYILRRLTREARVATTPDNAGKEIPGDCNESLALRLSNLQFRAEKVVEEGVLLKETYNIVKESLDQCLEQIQAYEKEKCVVLEIENNASKCNKKGPPQIRIIRESKTKGS
ncbi:hypothetical protein AAC387_Pa04g1076 [Persea americana]